MEVTKGKRSIWRNFKLTLVFRHLYIIKFQKKKYIFVQKNKVINDLTNENVKNIVC